MTIAKPAPGDPAIVDTSDPFDLDNLRLPQNFADNVGVKKLLNTIPIRRPYPQDWFRVHADPAYRENLPLLLLKDDREAFVVVRALQEELSGETVPCTIFTCINRQGVLSLWNIRLPGPDGRVNPWWQSAGEAAAMAMEKWVRLKSNSSLGAYEILVADSELQEPTWPDLPFTELLRIAFRDRIIDRIDHPVVQRLRGLT